jgi:Zn-dependent peptidase ImmA (M78 family)
MIVPRHEIIFCPDTALEISQLADLTLRKAGAKGRLPTSIDDLIASEKIEDKSHVEGIIERFIESVRGTPRSIINFSLQKLRGLADLRERAIYVPADTATRERFALAHELAHQKIPWHHMTAERSGSIYRDDDFSLSPDVKELFEVEANFFASEVIFQGKEFTKHARDYRPSFDAVFKLADLHGASRQATLRRYVEAQDGVVAALCYLPSRFEVDMQGCAVLRAPRVFGSAAFIQKYGAIQFPLALQSGHPWAEARHLQKPCAGDIALELDGLPIRFSWETWWNNYALLVLLRRRPMLSLVGRMLH